MTEENTGPAQLTGQVDEKSNWQCFAADLCKTVATSSTVAGRISVRNSEMKRSLIWGVYHTFQVEYSVTYVYLFRGCYKIVRVMVGVYIISFCALCCRLNETKSLINSHLYTPYCIARSPLPTVCHCGDDLLPACLNENSIFDRPRPTITYLTTMTDTCFHHQHSR